MDRDKPKSPKDSREARLAQALRANLRRRKGMDPKAPEPKASGEVSD